LDCERTHAQWQWECEEVIQVHSLNALLRLGFYLENNLSFPRHEDLWQRRQAERAQRKVGLQAIADADEVAPGRRRTRL
jgi:hypothetical protein